MLASVTEFPQAGSQGFLKPDATPIRILQPRSNGTALIAIDEPYKRASSTRTVDMAELAATAEEADAALQARRTRQRSPNAPKRRRSAR